MIEPERLDRAAHQALQNPPPVRLSLDQIAQRADTRRRRAQRMRAGAGVLAIVFAVGVGWALQGDDGGTIEVSAVEPASGGTIELAESGIWPGGGGAPTPSSLAEDFAHQVLGWPNATITTDEARPGDPTWVTMQDAVSGTDLRALAVPAADADHWRLIQIGTGLLYRPGDTGVRVELGTPPTSATQVAVYAAVDRGTQYFRGPINDTTTSVELTGITDRRELHSILILYQTADGQVIDAAGGVIDR